MRAASETQVAPPRESGVRESCVRLALAAGRAVIGRRFTELYRRFDETQWLPAAELLARSEERLGNVLEHARLHVPFYRELGLDLRGLRPMEALRRFPVMSKREYRAHAPERFHARTISAYRHIERATSGSTGEPFRFSIDRYALPVIFASHLFYDSWFGLRPFERYVRIVSPPAPAPRLPASTPLLYRLRQAATQRLQRMYEGWTQQKIMVWEVNADTAESIYRRIERFRPEFVMGYTSTLAVICDELLKRGLRLSKRVRGVITIAETLSPPRRKLIEDYFEAPIINRYGLREFGSWSAQNCPCAPDLFHLNTELVVCEVLREDGSPAAPGEIGRVVLTDLWNCARPFVRYSTGDLAVAGPSQSCACGRGFPLLGPIEGRSHECLHTPSGKVISPAILGHYLFVYNNNLDSVRHYQLVQEAPDAVRLLVMPSNRWTDGTAAGLAEAIDKLLGGEMSVVVEPVMEIPTEPSGKRPIIKSLVGSRG